MSDPSRSMAAACGAAALIICCSSEALAQAPASNATPAPAQTPAPTPTPAPAATPAPAPTPGSSTQLPSISVNAPRPVVHQRPKVRVATQQQSTTPSAPPQTEVQILAGRNDKLDEARQNIVAPDWSHLAPSQSSADRSDAAGKQRHPRQGAAAVSWRDTGLGRERRAACPQRARQPAIPHQRHHAARTASAPSARSSTPALSAAWRCSPARCRRNMACAPPACSTSRPRPDAFNNSGTVSVYGGSHGTITPSIEYGGTVGQTQYFVSGRFLQNNLGIENPTPANEAIHDRTSQEKGFLYLSTVLDPTSRLTFMSGVSNSTYQIPNNPGQTAQLHRVRRLELRFSFAQRAPERVQPVQCRGLPEIGRRSRLSDFLFQPLQPDPLLSRPDRRSRLQRRRVRRLPAERRQRHPGGHGLALGLCPYAALRLHRERGADAGQQRLDRCCRWPIPTIRPRAPSTRRSRSSIPWRRPARPSAPTSRTNGGSTTS